MSEILIHATTWMNLANTVPVTEAHVYYMIPCIQNDLIQAHL